MTNKQIKRIALASCAVAVSAVLMTGFIFGNSQSKQIDEIAQRVDALTADRSLEQLEWAEHLIAQQEGQELTEENAGRLNTAIATTYGIKYELMLQSRIEALLDQDGKLAEQVTQETLDDLTAQLNELEQSEFTENQQLILAQAQAQLDAMAKADAEEKVEADTAKKDSSASSETDTAKKDNTTAKKNSSSSDSSSSASSKKSSSSSKKSSSSSSSSSKKSSSSSSSSSKKKSSSSSSSSKKSSSSSSSKKSSSSSSSKSSSNADDWGAKYGLKPGDTFNGTVTDRGEIKGGGGNTYENGTFDITKPNNK